MLPKYQDKDRSILPESRNRGPDRHHDPGPFRLGIPCRNRKRTSGFPSAGRPWPRLPQPSRSLGADGSSSPSGADGAPASPSAPPSRTYAKRAFVHLASQVAKGLRPTKPCVLHKCGGLPWAGWAARFRSRWIVGGDTPPHHPPDLSRGAPGASLSVGARLRPLSALPRPPRSAGFAAPRPGRLRPSLAPPQRRPLSGAALAPLKPPSRQSVRHRVDSRDCGVAV